MKLIALILLTLSFSLNAKVVNSSINEDLEFKVKPDSEDQERSLATEEEVEEKEREEEVKPRDLASEKKEVKEDAYHDIRFWKY